MPDRPTRTLASLFTDIKGSAKIAQQFPAPWEALRARRHALGNQAMGTHGGYVFQIIGDAFYLFTAWRVEILKTTGQGKVVLDGRQSLLDGVTVSALRGTR